MIDARRGRMNKTKKRWEGARRLIKRGGGTSARKENERRSNDAVKTSSWLSSASPLCPSRPLSLCLALIFQVVSSSVTEQRRGHAKIKKETITPLFPPFSVFDPSDFSRGRKSSLFGGGCFKGVDAPTAGKTENNISNAQRNSLRKREDGRGGTQSRDKDEGGTERTITRKITPWKTVRSEKTRGEKKIGNARGLMEESPEFNN